MGEHLSLSTLFPSLSHFLQALTTPDLYCTLLRHRWQDILLCGRVTTRAPSIGTPTLWVPIVWVPKVLWAIVALMVSDPVGSKFCEFLWYCVCASVAVCISVYSSDPVGIWLLSVWFLVDDSPVVSKALTERPYVLTATRGQKRVRAHLPRGSVFPCTARALCRQEGWGVESKGG